MRRNLCPLLLLASAGCVSAAHGENPPQRAVLVELFTSQGCSSCPAADRFVADLPSLGFGRDSVVALTFHVNYWDELGWKDRFATPEFTDRQRWYAGLGHLSEPAGGPGLAGLYTPQMIVDGKVHFSGAQREVALEAFREAARSAAKFDLSTRVTARTADTVTVAVRVSARFGAAQKEAWTVRVALAAREARTQVLRGENRGETLREAAVVRTLSPPTSATAFMVEPSPVTVTKPEDLSWHDVVLAVFVQSTATGEVGAAASIATP